MSFVYYIDPFGPSLFTSFALDNHQGRKEMPIIHKPISSDQSSNWAIRKSIRLAHGRWLAWKEMRTENREFDLQYLQQQPPLPMRVCGHNAINEYKQRRGAYICTQRKLRRIDLIKSPSHIVYFYLQIDTRAARRIRLKVIGLREHTTCIHWNHDREPQALGYTDCAYFHEFV